MKLIDRFPRTAKLLKLARNDRGVAAVEFAFVVPILAAVVVGCVDVGSYYFFKMQTRTAAQNGVDYAMKRGYDATYVAAAASSGVNNLTVTADQFCGCANATTGITTVSGTAPNCTGSCSDGTATGVYASVKAELNYTPIMNWPFVDLPGTVSATSAVRLK